MDVLSHLMQCVRMHTALYGSVRLTAPWGVGIPRVDAAAFHAVLFGRCWMRLDDEGAWFELHRGDVVVLPHGHAHSFSDEQGSPIRTLHGITADRPAAQLPAVSLDPPADAAHTAVLCGHLWFEDPAAHPLVHVLPPVLHLRADQQARGWLEPLLRFVAVENQAPGPGTEAILARLGDVIVLQAIRAHLDHLARLPDQRGGWLQALAHPQLGQALGLIHQSPQTAWTVPRLAQRVGMSRSTFSARFTDLVGEPPQRYATRWRMHHAQGLLRESGATVATVARQVGYQTEPAFSRAFTRWVGTTPGAYRRATPTTSSPAPPSAPTTSPT